MSDATHADVRARIVADDIDDSTDDHLGTCDECARFVTDLARLRRVAPDLVPPAPEGLADRLVAASAGRPRAPRRPVVLIAGAAALVLAALAVVGSRDAAEPTPERMLLIAAERAEDAGGADVEVAAETDVEVAADAGQEPDFASTPAELQAYLTRRWAAVTAQANAQVDDARRRAQERLEQSMRNIPVPGRATAPPPPPPPPPPPAHSAPPAPPTTPGRSAVSLTTSVRATGTVEFGRGIHLDGRVATDAPGSAPQAFALRSGPRVGLVTTAGSQGTVAVGGGPLGELLLRPGAVGEVLRRPVGPVIDAGKGRTAAGVAVRRYRLVVADPSDPANRWNVEAAIDDAGLPRELRVQGAGDFGRPGTTWSSDVTVRLSGFAAPDRNPVEPPDQQAPASAAPGNASANVLYPFGPAVGASLRAATG